MNQNQIDAKTLLSSISTCECASCQQVILDGIYTALEAAERRGKASKEAVNIIFDGPPGPEGGRFVEVENDAGQSVKVGEWLDSEDGYVKLRIER